MDRMSLIMKSNVPSGRSVAILLAALLLILMAAACGGPHPDAVSGDFETYSDSLLTFRVPPGYVATKTRWGAVEIFPPPTAEGPLAILVPLNQSKAASPEAIFFAFRSVVEQVYPWAVLKSGPARPGEHRRQRWEIRTPTQVYLANLLYDEQGPFGMVSLVAWPKEGPLPRRTLGNLASALQSVRFLPAPRPKSTGGLSTRRSLFAEEEWTLFVSPYGDFSLVHPRRFNATLIGNSGRFADGISLAHPQGFRLDITYTSAGLGSAPLPPEVLIDQNILPDLQREAGFVVLDREWIADSVYIMDYTLHRAGQGTNFGRIVMAPFYVDIPPDTLDTLTATHKGRIPRDRAAKGELLSAAIMIQAEYPDSCRNRESLLSFWSIAATFQPSSQWPIALGYLDQTRELFTPRDVQKRLLDACHSLWPAKWVLIQEEGTRQWLKGTGLPSFYLVPLSTESLHFPWGHTAYWRGVSHRLQDPAEVSVWVPDVLSRFYLSIKRK